MTDRKATRNRGAPPWGTQRIRWRPLWGKLIALTALLAACNGAPTEIAPVDKVGPVDEGWGVVVAEAHVEPAHWVELEAPADVAGTITAAADEGDRLSAGDLVVQLTTRDAEIAVEHAAAVLAAAEAELARALAGTRPEEVAVSEAELEVALAEVAEAAAGRGRLGAGETQADIAAAEAALAAAQSEEKQAFYLHERTMKCFTFKWRGEKHTVCPALGRPEETARYNWHASQGELVAAKLELEGAENRAAARVREAGATLAGATARQSSAEAELRLQRAGNRLPEIDGARAEVRKAEVALETARAALKERSIRAPFDGTVAEIAVRVGDSPAPGQVLAVIASLDDLQFRTEDLTELDVVRIDVGHPVTVTLDALQDQTLAGRVVRIGDRSVDYRGDVTYPVFIELVHGTADLRWGMTASLDMPVN